MEAKKADSAIPAHLKSELSLKEVLEHYSHIELTEDEFDEAILWGKRKKEEELRKKKFMEVQASNRKIKEANFQFDVARTFMINRAEELFNGKFSLDESNEDLFNLMCYYHTDNPLFEVHAASFGVENPSLKKGILLAGNFGVGKTWMMKLFAKSARQTYFIRTAKEISQSYLNSPEKKIPQEYLEPFKNAINDASVFNQPYSGICIDDFGSEGLKNNYGNVSNVLGDLIEIRYQVGHVGPLLHGTTNLSAEELKKYYGERVTSRMREIFNWIILDGVDRRK